MGCHRFRNWVSRLCANSHHASLCKIDFSYWKSHFFFHGRVKVFATSQQLLHSQDLSINLLKTVKDSNTHTHTKKQDKRNTHMEVWWDLCCRTVTATWGRRTMMGAWDWRRELGAITDPVSCAWVARRRGSGQWATFPPNITRTDPFWSQGGASGDHTLTPAHKHNNTVTALYLFVIPTIFFGSVLASSFAASARGWM